MAAIKEGVEDWYIQPPYAGGDGARHGDNPAIAVTEFYLTPFDRLVLNSQDDSDPSEFAPGRHLASARCTWKIRGWRCFRLAKSDGVWHFDSPF